MFHSFIVEIRIIAMAKSDNINLMIFVTNPVVYLLIGEASVVVYENAVCKQYFLLMKFY